MKTRIKPTLKNLKAIDKAIKEHELQKSIWQVVKNYNGTDYRLNGIKNKLQPKFKKQ